MPQNEYDSMFASVMTAKSGGQSSVQQKPAEPAPAPKSEEKPPEQEPKTTPVAEQEPPKPVAPNYASQTRRDADAGQTDDLDDKLQKLKQTVRAGGDDKEKYSSLRPTKVMLPEGLVKLVCEQMPGGSSVKAAVAAFLYLNIATLGSPVALPADVQALVDNVHLDKGLDGVIQVMADMTRELRLANKKMRELMRQNTELEQLVAWLVLERKDMVQSRTEPVEAMDFQAPDITSLMRQTQVDAAARIKKQERAEGVQLDKRRGSQG